MTIEKDLLLKLALAVVLGAMIGFERERKNRPAGLRTYILVCLGATLVQIISRDLVHTYNTLVNADPARLGAQVISGIGFLGAGTIIREGASVKGLTTAAGLWVVACIGLAIGHGMYVPATFTALLAFITLTLVRRIEGRVFKKSPYLNVEVLIVNKPGQIGKIGQVLGGLNVSIRNIEFKEYEGETISVQFSLEVPRSVDNTLVMDKLLEDEGVLSIEKL